MKTLTKEDMRKGFLVLVNAEYPARENSSEGSFDCVGNQVMLNSTAAALLRLTMHHLGCKGEIAAVSGLRSKQEQEKIYSDSMRENGQAFTEKYVALPGCSEHQTGLAVDLALARPHIDPLTPHFPYDGICQTFRDAAARYGFIERYPYGKEHITGIGHEPWHFRYVGVPHAAVMRQNGLVLEEYIDLLRSYPFHTKPLRLGDNGKTYEIGFIKAGEEFTKMAVLNAPHLISGNNVDGFIVTKWC